MKKYIVLLLFTIFVLNGCRNDLPIYKIEWNFDTVMIDGTEYAVHKLSYDGDTYLSEPEQFRNPEYYDDFRIGKQIGRTDDDMQIHRVEKDNKRLVIKGFMFPAVYFKFDHSY